MRIWLVNEDAAAGEALADALRGVGHTVEVLDDWPTSHAADDDAVPYRLVLLDLDFANRDGYELLARIRFHDDRIPLIALSADNTLERRLRSLREGADDILAKPFELLELRARMLAVTRTRGIRAMPAVKIEEGRLSLNPLTRKVILDGRNVSLSGSEYLLLKALMIEPGKVLSRAELEYHVFGFNGKVDKTAIGSLTRSLRQKLGGGVVKNVRGIGWHVSS